MDTRTSEPCGIEPRSGSRPRVVIIGAGFGGLWAAKTLAGRAVDVLVLDRNNYHTFQPMLYQVAAAEVAHEDIVYPVRAIFSPRRNIRFLLDDVRRVDLAARAVHTAQHTFPYDYLILATGSATHFFGVPGAAEYAFQLKTLEQAVALRNHILFRFERALCETDPARRRCMLTFAIVGGGPTGIEYAGALIELIRTPLRRDYPALDFGEVRVVLLEAMDTLLAGFPASLQNYAAAHLLRMGVEVRFGATVTRITPEEVALADGTRLPAQTVVWTAGVRAEHPAVVPAPMTHRNGQIKITSTLQVPGFPEAFVIGDLAYLNEGVDGNPLPMVAPVATQQGRHAAENILRSMAGRKPTPFRYNDLGRMVTIGRNAAAAEVIGRRFTGFPAWALWLLVHLMGLIGFRNRLLVMINWAYDYLFFDRTVRLIVPRPPERSRKG